MLIAATAVVVAVLSLLLLLLSVAAAAAAVAASVAAAVAAAVLHATASETNSVFPQSNCSECACLLLIVVSGIGFLCWSQTAIETKQSDAMLLFSSCWSRLGPKQALGASNAKAAHQCVYQHHPRSSKLDQYLMFSWPTCGRRTQQFMERG